jgi:hypothetical protein
MNSRVRKYSCSHHVQVSSTAQTRIVSMFASQQNAQSGQRAVPERSWNPLKACSVRLSWRRSVQVSVKLNREVANERF